MAAQLICDLRDGLSNRHRSGDCIYMPLRYAEMDRVNGALWQIEPRVRAVADMRLKIDWQCREFCPKTFKKCRFSDWLVFFRR